MTDEQKEVLKSFGALLGTAITVSVCELKLLRKFSTSKKAFIGILAVETIVHEIQKKITAESQDLPEKVRQAFTDAQKSGVYDRKRLQDFLSGQG